MKLTLSLLFTFTTLTRAQKCADLDGNAVVDIEDLLKVLSRFGETCQQVARPPSRCQPKALEACITRGACTGARAV